MKITSEAEHSTKEFARQTLMSSIAGNLGDAVINALNDPEVIEIMLNPDGRLWIEKFGQPMTMIGTISPSQSENAIRLIGSAIGSVPTRQEPFVEGNLPLDGSRFSAITPPVSAGPTFTIRKKAVKIFTFDDYIAVGNLTSEAKDILEQAVAEHRNILVVGGTGSGKTTFVNAIVEAVARQTPHDRLVIIEDTAELQSTSENKVELTTTDFVDMKRLLKVTMRFRPDRILVGEVRDVAALSLVKAWNTGHEGGLATVHADNARKGMTRIEQLIAEGNYQPIKEVLADAIHLVVFMKKITGVRRVAEIVSVGFSETTKDYTFDYQYRFEAA